MIVFLTLIYVAVLGLLVKTKIVPWNLWTKISPAIWMAVLFVVLFLPLQFYAPAGDAVVVRPTVKIVPVVDGLVEKVLVQANQRVAKDDVLFQIDPTRYQAQVDRLSADLRIAQIRLGQSTEILKRGSGRQLDVDRDQANVDSTRAQLAAARWDLEHTTVRSPGDGTILQADALQPGARVVSMPLSSTMAFMADHQIIAAQIQQIFLRHIEPGQPVDVTFKVFPGEVFTGKVQWKIPASAQGQVNPTGDLWKSVDTTPGPFLVRIELDDLNVADRLAAGAVGSVAIYSGKMSGIYVIRRVMIWMDAWMNYVVPV